MLAESPETDTRYPIHPRDQNRVGLRGRVQKRWTPVLSWKEAVEKVPGGIKFLPITRTYHGLEVIDSHLSRSYEGQQGKDGVLFKFWQPIISDYKKSELLLLSYFACVYVCAFL